MLSIRFFLFTFMMIALQARSQYIHEVLEYKPAPGQFINKEPWGLPSSAQTIIGGLNGSLSLGAFGGYVIFRFENPVQNHPDNPYGVDFIIFGNPLQNFFEPGIVSVMKDENENGLPDGTWYELAGSDYFFSSTLKNYEITYTNPGTDYAANVPWTDNYGHEGVVLAGSFHTQPLYPAQEFFPEVDPDQYTLSGTHIKGKLDSSHPSMIKSVKRAFGYADNQFRGSQPHTLPGNPYTPQAENAGGDGFDISWAVDQDGNYVDLDEIHFIKVHTAVQGYAGWLGELSTEITGAVVVEPNPDISGISELVVIKDLSSILSYRQYQLEAFAFHHGRVQHNKQIIWTADLPGATIDENNVLHLTQSGELNLRASLKDSPDVYATTSVIVDLSTSARHEISGFQDLKIYPNPAKDILFIEGLGLEEVLIFNSQGQLVFQTLFSDTERGINLSGLTSGVYILQIKKNNRIIYHRFLKQ